MIRNEIKVVLFGVALLVAITLQVKIVSASEVSGSLCTGVNCPVEGVVITVPTASIAAGTYTSTQSVTLSATGASSIHYTTNGTDPTCTSGTTISGSSGTISVASSQTVKAISCYANDNHSTVASFAYTINISSGGNNNGGGGGGSAIIYCSAVTYGAWQSTCFSGTQFRSALTQTPTSCTLTAAQQLEQQRTCQVIPVEPSESVTPAEIPVTLSSASDQIKNIVAEAATISGRSVSAVLAAVGVMQNTKAEDATEIKYSNSLVSGLKNISAEIKDAITSFVNYGTPTTLKLGAGERAGVLSSYKSAFGKVPSTEAEWSDAIKIGNGRWPSERSASAEARATLEFKKVYQRAPNMSQANDNAAVTVIAYGLRPANRNTNSEKAAIKSFKAIYGHNPVSALAWDIVRAIAYSGATR